MLLLDTCHNMRLLKLGPPSLRGNIGELSGCHKDQVSAGSLQQHKSRQFFHSSANPPALAQLIRDSWMFFVGALMFPSLESAKLPNSSLCFWDRAFRAAVLGWMLSSSLTPQGGLFFLLFFSLSTDAAACTLGTGTLLIKA